MEMVSATIRMEQMQTHTSMTSTMTDTTTASISCPNSHPPGISMAMVVSMKMMRSQMTHVNGRISMVMESATTQIPMMMVMGILTLLNCERARILCSVNQLRFRPLRWSFRGRVSDLERGI